MTKEVNMKFQFILILLFLAGPYLKADGDIYKDSGYSIEERVEDLVGRMTLEEKMNMLYGIQTRTNLIQGNERLGIPDFTVYHGPIGMKVTDESGKRVIGTYFPVSIAMAATFDDAAIESLGAALGAEIRAYGGYSNAGPAMNIIRDPRTGRSFEYFTEDPYLNARIAVANVKGQQSSGIGAIIKHYACNNQEQDRYNVDVKVSERALREIYLPGFEAAVKEGDARIVMSGYNLVNGHWCAENGHLLNEILREDWGFDGFVMSDWGGTHSTVKMAMSGMDVEMPKEKWFGDRLLDAVRSGEVPEDVIDGKVSNVLRVLFRTGAFEGGKQIDRSVVRSQEHLDIARKVASESMVLLKNGNGLLPLSDKVRKIAVIGPNGDYGPHFRGGKYNHGLLQGGGSSNVATLKENMVTPFRGISGNAPEGTEVAFAPGCYAESGYGPIPLEYLTAENREHGIDLEYYASTDCTGRIIKREMQKKASYVWARDLDIPEENGQKEYPKYSIVLTSEMTVPEDGVYGFEVRNESGSAELFIDGIPVASNLNGNRIYWHGTGDIRLEAGKTYELMVKYVKKGDKADLSINWNYENIQYLKEAKALAARSDVVILTVGLSGQMGETEAGDRLTLDLAPAQENLINEIYKVNRNTVVAVVAGSAVTMNDWIDSATALLYAWYPGEQGGNALADIIFGKVSPAGRLPITFPESDDVYPPDFYSTTGQVEYKEDVFVGYRYFDRYEEKVLFPFGFGLSYTDFEYTGMESEVVRNGDDVEVKVTFDVENTGKVAGDEVVQLYVSDPEASVRRPEKELKEFVRICLAPGEKKKLQFILDERSFSYWDESRGGWRLEPGKFRIMAASSSEDIRLNSEIIL